MHWNEENGIKVFRLRLVIYSLIYSIRKKIDPKTLISQNQSLKKLVNLPKNITKDLRFILGSMMFWELLIPRVLKNTLLDLKVHADILDLIGCNQDSVMVIHGGGFYGDKLATIERWVKNYKEADPIISNRLVLENCEKMF